MSNSKDLSRQEEFKRATAGAVRAIARTDDVQVAFQPGPSGLTGKRARLPLPTRALPPAEMARLFRDHPDALRGTLRVLDACRGFSLPSPARVPRRDPGAHPHAAADAGRAGGRGRGGALSTRRAA